MSSRRTPRSDRGPSALARTAGGGVLAALLLALPTVAAAAPGPVTQDPAPPPAVDGPVSPLAAAPVTEITSTSVELPDRDRSGRVLNDNGGWCWFQDERTIFTRDGRLMVSSVADKTGTDGPLRDGGTEVTSVDLRSGATWTDVVYKGLPSDDHNAAALLELSDRTLALATSHSADPNIYRAHLDPGGLGWVTDGRLHRPEAAAYDPALGRHSGVTYSNLAHLAQENGGRGRVYDIFRSAGETQHLITSDDHGRTWQDHGRIFSRYRAYIRMVSDGQRRIWFSITDGHPANFDGTSLYGGYIEGGAIHRSDGTVVAPLGQPVDPQDLTPIFAGTPGPEAQQTDAWGSDIALDAQGNPVVTLSTTIPGRPLRPGRQRRHEARYARWDGSSWQQHLMGDAGTEVGAQVHYTGLSTIDPGDPDRVFLSTDADPTTGTPLVSARDGLVHHEIFEGRTEDGGASWSWAAVTTDSTEDNLRPIVPNPRDGNWALTWMRGSYFRGTIFDLDVVAIINPDGPGTLPPEPGRPQRPPWGVRSATPMASDLDGDGFDDLTFWGPGPATDAQISFLPRGRRRSVYRRQDLGADGRPLTGDFDGDGRADILWYDPDDPVDRIWWTSPTGNPENIGIRPPAGSFSPAVGDFDGDGRDDIFWYQAGPARDLIWWGRPDRGFTATPTSVRGIYLPVVGDLDGDGRDDITWYGPGSAPDFEWFAEGGRRFSSQRLFVGAWYHPVTGDVDGDGHAELLWHAPGAVADRRWDVDRGRRITSRPFQVWGTYQPVAGDYDGDGRDDLLWSTPSTGAVDFAYGGTDSYLR